MGSKCIGCKYKGLYRNKKGEIYGICLKVKSYRKGIENFYNPKCPYEKKE